MDRDETAARVPLTYRRVTAWLAEGRSSDEIAVLLGVDPDAVPALIDLAIAKLARAAGAARPDEEH